MPFASGAIAAMPQGQANGANDVVRVNLLVPATLRKEWKAMALASDKTLTDFIIEAMHEQINRAKNNGETTK